MIFMKYIFFLLLNENVCCDLLDICTKFQENISKGVNV